MSDSVKKGLIAVGVLVVASTSAHAAITPPILDSGDALIVGGAVLTGLAAIWGIRQAIYLVR